MCGLTNTKIGEPGDYLEDFEIPARAVKSDGLPGPFVPTDITLMSSITDNIRGQMEATALYQICYSLQKAVNEASDAYHSHATYTATDTKEYYSFVLHLQRLHRIAFKRYDSLETKQPDLMLTREYERVDIPAVNLHRGAIPKYGFDYSEKVARMRDWIFLNSRMKSTEFGSEIRLGPSAVDSE